MTGINHILTGTLVATAIKNPPLAISLAFVSHFLLDVLPHFGVKGRIANNRLFMSVLIADIVLIASFIIFLTVAGPTDWPLYVAASLASLAPDFTWFPNFFRDLAGRERKPYAGLVALHKRIQWCERPWGIFVEIAWLVLVGWAVLARL